MKRDKDISATDFPSPEAEQFWGLFLLGSYAKYNVPIIPLFPCTIVSFKQFPALNIRFLQTLKTVKKLSEIIH